MWLCAVNPQKDCYGKRDVQDGEVGGESRTLSGSKQVGNHKGMV